jgi:hypothetical protein
VDLRGGSAPSVTIYNETKVVVCIGSDGHRFTCTDADGDGYTAEESYRQCEEKGDFTICAQALRAGDCDDNDPTVFPGADEVCDGKDNDCNGVVDDVPEGVNCECLSDADCDDGVFCNGAESCGNNICQAAPGGACPSHLVCEEANDRCIACLTDADCLGVEVCNMTSNTCELVSCPDDGDPCTTGAVHDHICEHAPINGCCHGPTSDAECASSRPANLPDGYLWGCSAAQVPPLNLYHCTACSDQDGDGVCAADEICGNGLDDDGDGLVDEPPCVSQGSPDRSQCPVTGVGVLNITSSTVSVQLGRTFQSQPQIEGPDSFSPQEEKFDPSATGMWLWPRPDYNAWAAMTATQKLTYCTDNWRGRDRCGIIFLPRLTLYGDCEFPMDP